METDRKPFTCQCPRLQLKSGQNSCVHQDITLINTRDSCHLRQKPSLVGVGGITAYKLTPFHLSSDKLVSVLFTSGLQPCPLAWDIFITANSRF